MSMLESRSSVSNSIHPAAKHGMFPDRKPQRHQLADATVVSADNHICLGGSDFFYENAPAGLKDRVPRIVYEKQWGFWNFTFNGRWLYPVGSDEEIAKLIKTVEGHEGAWNVDHRVRDMDAEGVDMEIAFPQVLPGLFTLKDFEAREYIMREYNNHLIRLQNRAPGRFYGVGIMNFWDPQNAKSWVQKAKADGFKVLMLPNRAGAFPNGKEIAYSSDDMKPMWAALEEAGMTVAFHIGEVGGPPGKGGFAAGALGFLGPTDFRLAFGKLVFGGVLDDFPKLRVVFAEAGISWVPGMLQDADVIPDCFGGLIDYKPKLSATEYWARNCYATFMRDPAGLRLIDKIGVKNALWSVDYPHNEGTFGYTGDVIDSIVDQVGKADAKRIVGANAREVFGI